MVLLTENLWILLSRCMQYCFEHVLSFLQCSRVLSKAQPSCVSNLLNVLSCICYFIGWSYYLDCCAVRNAGAVYDPAHPQPFSRACVDVHWPIRCCHESPTFYLSWFLYCFLYAQYI